jgi:serine/threonine protein kinase
MQPRKAGRYIIYDRIASGGMASVYFGRLQAAGAFSRTVAIKELHPHFAGDPEFTSMFLDEARIAARIQHPNVAIPLDVVLLDDTGEIFLIMEYVHGDTLSRLLRAAPTEDEVPPAVVATIVSGALHGLHAAHEARDERGAPLHVVHRDISPQNIMVGVDGAPRILDFGIAKAISRSQSTREGQFKGKLSYMAPEQMGPGPIDRRADIFAAGVVLWEALTRRRLFAGDDPGAIVSAILQAPIPPPSRLNKAVSPALDRVVEKALSRDLLGRYQTARELATAIEESTEVASPRVVGEWVARVASKVLAERAAVLKRIDSISIATMSGPEATPDGPSSRRGAGPSSLTTSGPTLVSRPGLVDGSGGSLGPGELLARGKTSSRDRGRRKLAGVAAGAGLLILLLGAGRAWIGRGSPSSPASASPAPLRAAAAGALAPRSAVPRAVSSFVALPSPQPRDEAPETAATAATTGTSAVERPSPRPQGGGKPTPSRKIHALAKKPAPHRQAIAPAHAKGVDKAKPSAAPATPRNGPVGVSCVPPYTVDAAGIRRVKPGCH